MTDAFNSPLDDQATRGLAQNEFSKPLIVEAGAGTGKTALLVARVAAWCVGAGWRRHHDAEVDRDSLARRVIEGVVAITFTEAAAAEMATRIGEALPYPISVGVTARLDGSRATHSMVSAMTRSPPVRRNSVARSTGCR